MQYPDQQALMRELKDIEIRLPLHQEALRAHLLALYHQQTSRHFWMTVRAKLQSARTSITATLSLETGVAVVLLGALVISALILWSPTTENRAQQFALAAVQKTQHMSHGKIAQISEGYKSLDTCLEEAIKSATLRILAAEEIDSLIHSHLQKEHPSAAVYLTYANKNHHRIVIALDAHNEPLYAVDADEAEARAGH